MGLERLSGSKLLSSKGFQKRRARRPRLLQVEGLEMREMMDATGLEHWTAYGPQVDGIVSPSPIARPTGSLMRYVPNDPYYNRFQWQMKDYDAAGGISKGANIEQAWDFVMSRDNGNANNPNSFGLGDGVLIAFVDTGVQFDHPDLAANARPTVGESCDFSINPQFCLPTGGPTNLFTDMHGTSVAGLAVATRDNALGISGVAPDAHWVSNKVLPTTPVGARNPADIGEAGSLSVHNPFCSGLPAVGPMRTRLGQTFFSDIDIFNNSWGPIDGVDWRTAASIPGPAAQGAIDCGLAFGRGGLGSIYVWAAGNGGQFGDNVNYDQYANSRKVIAVGAIDNNGQQAVYSEPGASLLVVAPSSGAFQIPGGDIPPEILTTDVVSTDTARDLATQGDTGGYNYHTGPQDPRGNPPFPNDNDSFEDINDPQLGLGYTSFGHYSSTDNQGALGGTSAAAPIVSGIIALMLDVNPNLTWRDVQHILVRSTYQNDGADADWATNRAGFKVNHKYGFGAIDALAAVTTAANWPTVGAQQVFSTGRMPVLRAPTDPVGTVGRLIPDNAGPIAQLFNFATDCSDTVRNLQCTLDGNALPVGYTGAEFPKLEWIEVVLETDHQFAGDLEVTLYAPDASGQPGQFRSVLARKHNSGENYDNWVFTTARHWGETAQGQWRLEIKDTTAGNTGTWVSWQMNFYGGSVPPIALADSATASSGITKVINVLQNDTGAFVSNTVQISTPAPAGHTVQVRPDGRIAYTSPAGFTGTITFAYRVADQFGQLSNPATVTVRVIPFNPAPVATDDVATTIANTPVVINLLANDFDPPPNGGLNPSSVIIVQAPPSNQGSIGPVVNGVVTFTPAAGFLGEAVFSYNVKDQTGRVSNNAKVRVTVGPPPPPPPTATNDTVAAVAGVQRFIDILANDFAGSGAPPLDRSSVTITLLPSNGSLGAPDPVTGIVSYKPDAGFPGTDIFQYFIRDTSGRPSAVATVTINVNAQPEAVNDTVITDEEHIVMINVAANDSDPDPDGFLNLGSIQIVSPPTKGTVTVDPVTHLVRFVPSCDVTGVDTFTYRVSDNEGLLSNTATVFVTINASSDPPKANDDVAGTDVNTPVIISPWANDTDVDAGDSVNPSSIIVPFGGGPQHGSIVYNPVTFNYTYTPNAGFSGADSFTYFVRDQNGVISNQGTVRIRVGAAVSISGLIFVDINNNGVKDSGEVGLTGVEVRASLNNGGYSHTQSVRTNSLGEYAFIDNPNDPLHPIIMPPGTYTLTEVQPGLFADDGEKAGTPAPVSISNDRFTGITLAGGQSATNYRFDELALRGDFVVNHLSTTTYFASASLQDGVNDTDPFVSPRPASISLSNGNVWFSFDQGLSGRYFIEAVSNDGNARLDLYNNNSLTAAVATSGAAKPFSRIEFNGTALPQFLRVSGSGSNFTLRMGLVDECVQTLTPPSAEVLVGSSSWTIPFLNHLQAQSLGSGGYRIPAGDVAQLDPVTFANLNQVILRFSEPTGVTQSSLKITGSNHGVYATNGFSYDVGTNTATWTVATPLVNDRILLDLNSPQGNIDLKSLTEDGEFFRFNVLPGDVNRNGATNFQDVILVNNRVGEAIGDGGYGAIYDLNGSGVIDSIDRTLAIANNFKALPAGQVPLPAPSPAAPDAVVVAATAAPSPAAAPTVSSSVLQASLAARARARQRLDVSLRPNQQNPLSSADSNASLRIRRGHRGSAAAPVQDEALASFLAD